MKAKSREELLGKLAERIDEFKRYTRPHSRFVMELSSRLARRLGLPREDVAAVAEAALLHDIGLYAMSPAYCRLARSLSREDRIDLWRHPVIGEQQLAKRDSSRLAQLLVRWHHESWDGTGYPDRLAFEDIPIGARILRAVELFCSLTSDRPYRSALSEDEALDVLKSSAGIECDPYVVMALVALLEEFRADTEAEQTRDSGLDGKTEEIVSIGVATAETTVAPKLLPPIRDLLFRSTADDPVGAWKGWSSSRYNRKSLLGFEASVLRQLDFGSVAIPHCGWARLDAYLKGWGKQIASNDPRVWAAAASRLAIETARPLEEEEISVLLEDVYVPGRRLANPSLRRWFGETDAWWLDNLRRNINSVEDDILQAHALVAGLMTGDYTISFSDETGELRRPLSSVFRELARRVLIHGGSQPGSRSHNLPTIEFLKRVRAELLYINLPTPQRELVGPDARSEWRECWVAGSEATAGDDTMLQMMGAQSKQTFLDRVGLLLRAASHFKTWAIGYQELGLASAREISELIKEYRPVRAVYSKDLTEVAGGLRSYIIIAGK